MSLEIDWRVDAGDWPDETELQALIERVAAAVSAETGASGEAALMLSDDARMHALNRQFRGKDKPTDVLSFPAEPESEPFLGDIAIGDGIARADAASMGKSFDAHLSHLVAHGLLHLLGYDHEEEVEAEEMENLERRVLASLGLPDPYSHWTEA